MKIAIFCPTVSGQGGMEAAIRNLMSGFEELGDEVRLFLLGGSYRTEWLEGIPYTQIGSINDSRWKRMLHYATGPTLALFTWRPDAIICADLTTLKMARWARLLTGNLKMLIASWVHFPLAEIRMRGQLSKADLHLAIATSTAKEIEQELPAHKDRIFTIYNAVDVRQARTIARPKSPVFLYIGRLNLNDHKRTNDVLEAAALLHGTWQLKIIGSATKGYEAHESQLRDLAQTLGIADRVDWMGWRDEPWEAVEEATAFLLSSEREAFGMVLVEACSHGVACISSACGGPTEIIQEGRNGWLYPVGDTTALAARLQSILDDPGRLPSQHQVQETVQRFSVTAVAGRAREGILRVETRS
jgi:UDP-D-galactose:(glucosyl)LPS alpha-1,6-D-galactosyltransferase